MSYAALENSRRPKGGKTGLVWEIADQISREKGREATSNEVIDAVARAGGSRNTAATQYYVWKKHFNISEHTQADGVSEAPASPFLISLQIASDGRVLIPADLRRLMKIAEDGRLTASIVDGELRLVSPTNALERLQRMISFQDKGTTSVIDELLQDRRNEAAL